jgi:hypothetical protein
MQIRSSLRVGTVQRVVLIIHSLSVAYCCVWIPWRSTTALQQHVEITIIYSFIWRAPGCDCQYDNGIEPALVQIFLRIVAVTAVATAAFLVAGMQRRAAASDLS